LTKAQQLAANSQSHMQPTAPPPLPASSRAAMSRRVKILIALAFIPAIKRYEYKLSLFLDASDLGGDCQHLFYRRLF
jgi:hypothetical protein